MSGFVMTVTNVLPAIHGRIYALTGPFMAKLHKIDVQSKSFGHSSYLPSLGLAGLLVLADVDAVAVRTVLTGTAAWLDTLVISPGMHRQNTASELHRGEYPAVAAMTTGYVFRVENPAMVYYLQKVSRTAHLTTLKVEQARCTIPSSFTPTFIYRLCVLNTLLALDLMGVMADYWFIAVILLLMLARLLNVIAITRRTAHVWSGASEPGVVGDLLVLLSQDRWVRIRGLVDDLKAVTSGSWLQPATVVESCLQNVATLLIYAAVIASANMTFLGQIVLMLLLVFNLGSLALSNQLMEELNMFGRKVKVQSVSEKYNRRLDMAGQLINEVKRDDWAVKLGMIGVDRVKYSKASQDEVIV